MTIPVAADSEFKKWAHRWIDLAAFRGKQVPDEAERIEKIVALWHEPIPPGWERGRDARLLNRELRYRRSQGGVRRGEYIIEGEVLDPSPAIMKTVCLGAYLVDGVNAVPLAKDVGGRRSGNVEADMLLLVRDRHEYRLLLVEVKTSSNHAWYAAVENLRQLRLFLNSPETQMLFNRRCPELDLPERLPVTAVVLAPVSFYGGRGRTAEAVDPAERLLRRMRAEDDVKAELATWEPNERAIWPLRRRTGSA